MANRNPNSSTRFKSGQQSKPGPGRKPVSKDLVDVAEIGIGDIKRIISRQLNASQEENQALLDDPHSSMIDVNIASGLAKGKMSGDLYQVSKLLERIMGKVSDEPIVVVPPNPAAVLSDDDIVKLLNRPLAEEISPPLS